MYISYNWLKEFLTEIPEPSALENILTMLGIEVESIIDYRNKFDKFVIAQVITAEKHPNADKLTVCRVGWGLCEGTIICGAPNVAEGQKVVLGLPGAKVPQNGMLIEERAIRGAKSEGMICSQFELGIGEDKSGIWVLPNDSPLGEPISEYLRLNDIIFDISVTPNRADCLSHLGIAREIAAYLRAEVIYNIKDSISSNSNGAGIIKISILDTIRCPRYTAHIIRNCKNGPSPLWLQARLLLSGMRPVNVAVDVTNFVLLECGQPLHAFDFDTLEGGEIVVKTARQGEKFTTLDGKEKQLSDYMLMICDANKPIAIGGVMGGQNTEITEKTTNILLESAYFNPSSIRKTSKALGIQSESSYRFERGVDPDMVALAASRAVAMIAELTGGTIEGGVTDAYPAPVKNKEITVRFNRINELISTKLSLSGDELCSMLTALQFKIAERADDYAIVVPPSFRVDMALEIDVVEEIARLYNYDNIEPDYASTIDFGGGRLPESLAVPELKRSLRYALANWGFNELLSQNITDPASAGLFGAKAIQIANPLGEELSSMRTTLLASALKIIAHNKRNASHNLKLFEIGKTFHYSQVNNNFIEGIRERESLIAVMTGKAVTKQWDTQERQVDFYDIKGLAEQIVEYLKLTEVSMESSGTNPAGFSEQCLTVKSGDCIIGVFGKLEESLLKREDISSPVYALVFDLEAVYSSNKSKWAYIPASPYPLVQRDLAFLLDESVESGLVKQEILNAAGELLKSVELFDLFVGKPLESGKKSLAYSLIYSSPDRTLVDAEVERSISAIIEAIENKFGAKLRQ